MRDARYLCGEAKRVFSGFSAARSPIRLVYYRVFVFISSGCRQNAAQTWRGETTHRPCRFAGQMPPPSLSSVTRQPSENWRFVLYKRLVAASAPQKRKKKTPLPRAGRGTPPTTKTFGGDRVRDLLLNRNAARDTHFRNSECGAKPKDETEVERYLRRVTPVQGRPDRSDEPFRRRISIKFRFPYFFFCYR